MTSPLVSVLIPAFNVENYIVAAINSITNQSYSNLEIVVIDDASTDQTVALLESLSRADNRIKLYRNERNLGLSLNRNKGLEFCSGEYIALMDSDDISTENRIQTFVDFLELNTEYDAVSSWMQIFDDSGGKEVLTYRTNIEMIKIASIFYSPLAHAASMFKSKVLKELKYSEEINFGEDYDLWLRFLQHHKVHVFEEVFYMYRRHGNQSIDKSKLDFNKFELLKVVDRIYSILGINLNDEWKLFHVNYIFIQENMVSKEEFLKWNGYLEILYNAIKKSNFINSKKFLDFVFLNYWQNYYTKFLTSFTLKEMIKVSQQKFNKTSKLHKVKKIVLKYK